MRYPWKDSSAEKHELNIGNIGRGISICLLTAASPALANPQGGNVAAGSATIKYGQTTVVTQTTGKAIVNWKDDVKNGNYPSDAESYGLTEEVKRELKF